MNPDENKSPSKNLRLLQKIGVLLLAILIFTFYILSINFIIQ